MEPVFYDHPSVPRMLVVNDRWSGLIPRKKFNIQLSQTGNPDDPNPVKVQTRENLNKLNFVYSTEISLTLFYNCTFFFQMIFYFESIT